MKSRHGGRLWIIVGFLVSFACIAVGVQRVHWPEVYQSFLIVRWKWVALGAFLLVASFILFARRWRATLLHQKKLPTRLMFGYLSIGYMINSVLPLRAGDVVRAFVLRTRHSLTTGVVVASVVIERLLDLLIIVTLGVSTAFFFDLPAVVRNGLLVLSIATGFGFAALALLAIQHPIVKKIRATMSGAAPATWLLFIQRYLRPFLEGFRILHSPIDLLRILFWSVCGWACFVAGMMCYLESFGLGLPWTATAVVVVSTGLGSAIPSSPGALGVYHAVVVFALALFQVPTETAVAFAVVAHTTTILLQIALGTVSSLILGINALRAAQQIEETPAPDPVAS